MGQDNGDKRRRDQWSLHREQILLGAGLAVIFVQIILASVGAFWSYQFVLAGLALCGVAITQLGNKP